MWRLGELNDCICTAQSTVQYTVPILPRVPQCLSLFGIGTHPPPFPQLSVSPPPEPKAGEGTHSPAAKGMAESQFRRLEKKPVTLSTL